MTEKTRIAFASCCRYKNFPEQPQWQKIADNEPDCLILLGDQIYMDFGLFPFSREYNGKPKKYSPETFERIMREKYEQQWSEPHFRQLLDTMRARNALFAIWDDHDFAWDNACGNEVADEIKAISRSLFHEFLDCSTNRPEIYCHGDIANARIIMLDNRSYADKPPRWRRNKADMLGDKQWQFLTEKLQNDKPYTLVCSGISINNGFEKWTRYTREHQRLRELLHKKDNVLFLAGDIHQNRFNPPSNTHPCYEIVSSGIGVNLLGLPFGISNKQNHGQIDLGSDTIDITLYNKRCSTRYRIDSHNWQHRKI